MRIAEVLLEDFDVEMANTRRTLERVPEDKPDYRPHQKSMPMGRLAMHCATLPLMGALIIEEDSMDLGAPKRPWPDLMFRSRQECLEHLAQGTARCRELLAAASDDQMSAKWRFSWGEQILLHEPRSRAFRSIFFDHLVHHVAQLGVYLRLNDVPVPALYGPSADEQWTRK
ncbi:MAG: DinB family protein [Acidobacteriaceae bacterium]|nr:DinB family protein [Acidobacteriaceae bacterium]